MINLLPPDVKSQLRFAQHNARLVRYLWLLAGLVIVVGGALGATYYYLTFNIGQADTQLSQQTVVIDHFQTLQSQVAALNARASAIQAIQQGQPKFSKLLSDLAAVTPKGVFINSVTLTGNSATPVLIAATATNYNQAVAFRDALATSPRVAAADIAAINSSSTGINVQINVAFKPGEAD